MPPVKIASQDEWIERVPSRLLHGQRGEGDDTPNEMYVYNGKRG